MMYTVPFQKFIVGDRVKVLSNTESGGWDPGTVGTITEILDLDIYKVCPDEERPFSFLVHLAEELELLEREAPENYDDLQPGNPADLEPDVDESDFESVDPLELQESDLDDPEW